LAESPEIVRVGLGFDVHPIVRDREMRFLGVLVSSQIGLEGFSDGDALSHSVADALLGAAGLGDIGSHFPAGNAQFKGISGQELLARTVRILENAGWKPLQIDSVVWLEYPLLASHLTQIRQRLAEVLGLPEASVSIKLKRGEGLGFVGGGLGIAVWAVALVIPSDSRPPQASDSVRSHPQTTSAPFPLAGIEIASETASAEKDLAPRSSSLAPSHKDELQETSVTQGAQGWDHAVIYIDGGAEPNPGPASAGIVFQFPDGSVKTAGKFLGQHLTNNEAEYLALIWSLEEAARLQIPEIEIRSDSELLVSQVTGAYQVRKPHLRLLHAKVMELQKKFKRFRIVKIPRSQNRLADESARKALAGQ
jgi:2-C-methyl-D-erythritol 2,4-cyclodiphosphate synthase